MQANVIRRNLALVLILAGIVAIAIPAITSAQTPTKPILTLRGTSANVDRPNETVRIDLLRWSTDAERDQLMAAWNPPPAPPAGAGGGNRGGGPAGGGAAAGGGGARGGGGGAPAAPTTPESRVLTRLQAAPTLGYLWTTESVGYSIRYAHRIPAADGTERIILALDRRLTYQPAAGATPTDYQFTFLELRLNARGEGQGKATLSTKVVPEDANKTLAVENYATAPVLLNGIKK